VRGVPESLAGLEVEDVDALDAHLDLVGTGGLDDDVRLAEDDEEVARAGVLQLAGHVKVGVNPGLEDRDAPGPLELGGVSVVVEGAGKDGED